MKQFWRKIIFADHPAQGAFFALWLLMLGSYIGSSLLFLVNWRPSFPPFSLLYGPEEPYGDLLLWPCANAVLLMVYVFYNWRFCLKYWIKWRAFAVVLTAWSLLIAWLVYRHNDIAFDEYIVLEILGICLWGIPATALIFCGSWRICWRGLLANALMMTATCMLLLALPHFDFSGDYLWSRDLPNFGETPIRVLHLENWPWEYYLAMSVILLIAGALLYGNVLAASANIDYCQLWGKAVIALLILCAAVYAIGWLLAIGAEHRMAAVHRKVEDKYQCEVTVAELATRYYAGRQPDAAFWRAIYPEKMQLFWYERRSYDHVNPFADLSISPGLMKQADEYFASQKECIAVVDRLLSSDIPLVPEDFVRGEIIINYRWGVPCPVSFLDEYLLLRLRWAAERQDAETARLAFHEIEKLTDYFNSQVYFSPIYTHERHFGPVTKESVNDYYQLAIVIMLERQLLSDDDIVRCLGRLREYERVIDLRHQPLQYWQTVGIWDFWSVTVRERRRVGSRVFMHWQARWFMPASWYYLSDCCAEAMTAVTNDNLPESWKKLRIVRLMYCTLVNPALDLRDAYLAQKAVLRTVAGLLKVEEYKRSHGDYPQTMTGLPVDPYTGKPLLYRRQMFQQTVKTTDDEGEWRVMEIKYPLITVWSIGRDKVDDNEKWLSAPYENRFADDIRSMIRIDLEKKP